MDTQKKVTLHQGSTLQDGRYTIVRVLGQGGFGITYQAMTTEKVTGKLGEMEVEVPVAIKEFFMKDTCLRDSYNNNVSIPSTGSVDQVDKYRQKFIKEAHNLAQLNHPNIVHVADVFEENNTVYYVMQFLRDGSLRDLLKDKGRLPEEDAVRYTLQIAKALNYMHNDKHMCHYDVKPANILLNGDKAMLIDFGISKNYTSDGRETSATPVGLSKGFAPLEQFQQSLQDFSPVSDIYSLGATLYNLVTGMVPPEASVVNEEGLGQRPDYVSEHVWDVIVTAMQPRRKDRPQSMEQLITLLEAKPIPAEVVNEPQPADAEETIVGGGDEVIITSKPPVGPPPIPGAPRPAAPEPEPPMAAAMTPAPEDESTLYHTPTPEVPKPEVPKPEIPKPEIPKPEIPKPAVSEPEAPKPEPAKPQVSQAKTPASGYASYNVPPKRKSKAPLIIVIFLVFLLIGGALGFFVVNKFLGSDTPDVAEVATVENEPIYGSDGVAFFYTGQVDADKKPNGKGTARYNDQDKDTYTGHFENGMRVDANATLTFKNGDTYKGSFVNDQFGEGVYTIAADKSYFKGTFRNFAPYDGAWYSKSDKLLYKVVNGVDKVK